MLPNALQPPDGQKTDIASLLQLIEYHQQQHTSHKRCSDRNCISIQSRLHKIYPKLIRSISPLEPDIAITNLSNLCTSFLVLQTNVCPYADLVFMEQSDPFSFQKPHFMSFGILYFYQLSFYCNPQFDSIKDTILSVLIQFGLLLCRYDSFAFLHIARDTLVLLQEIFLYEQQGSHENAVFYPHINTAVHLFHTATGALAQKNSMENLCGCMEIRSASSRQERIQQLEKLLPSVNIASHAQAIHLRRKLQEYLIRLIESHSVLLCCDPKTVSHGTQLCKVFYYYDQKSSAHAALETTVRLYRTFHWHLIKTKAECKEWVKLFFQAMRVAEVCEADISDCLGHSVTESMDRLESLGALEDALVWDALDTWMMVQLRGPLPRSSCGLQLVLNTFTTILMPFIASNAPYAKIAKRRFMMFLETFSDHVIEDRNVSDRVALIAERLLSTKDMQARVIQSLEHEVVGEWESDRPGKQKKQRLACTQGTLKDNEDISFHKQFAQWIIRLLSSNSRSIILAMYLLLPLQSCTSTQQGLLKIQSFILSRLEGSLSTLLLEKSNNFLTDAALALSLLLLTADDAHLARREPMYAMALSHITGVSHTTNKASWLSRRNMVDITVTALQFVNTKDKSVDFRFAREFCWKTRGYSLPYLIYLRHKCFQSLSTSHWTQAIDNQAWIEYSPSLAVFLAHANIATPRHLFAYLLEYIVSQDERKTATNSNNQVAFYGALSTFLCLISADQEGNIPPTTIHCAVKHTGQKLLTLNDKEYAQLRCHLLPEPHFEMRAAQTILWLSMLKHLDFSKFQALLCLKFVKDLLNSLCSQQKSISNTVLEDVKSLISNPTLYDAIERGIDDDILVSLLMQLIQVAIAENKDMIFRNALAIIGSLCRSCSKLIPHEANFLVTGICELIILWSANRDRMEKSAAIKTEIDCTLRYHTLSCKDFCEGYAESVYSRIICHLLPSHSVSAFLRAFFSSDVDVKTFLRASAPYTLPTLILSRDKELLKAFEQAVDTRNTKEQDSSSALVSMSDMVLAQIEHILKELIMCRMDFHETSTAAWQFLFQYLPENTTIRDAVLHSPLRLMNLLVWELGGKRYQRAQSAFHEVVQYISSSESDPSVRGEQSQFLIPQHYFLALVTELCNKMNSANHLQKVRASQCLVRFFLLLDTKRGERGQGVVTQGFVDPFVPKIMAAFKSLMAEDDLKLKENGIHAWSAFIELLSMKALEANMCAIVVNTASYYTSCTGPSSDAILRVLRYFFIEKNQHLRHVFPRIPFLPETQELSEIRQIVIQQVGNHEKRSIDALLTDCIEYINHWDVSVRQKALVHVYQSLVGRVKDLQNLIQTEMDIFVHATIGRLLSALLKLSKTESLDCNRLLCAKCLGAIGAIDTVHLPPASRFNLARSGRMKRTEYSTKELTFSLIETWFVSELRAAPENTDSLAFAIQELLHFLAQLGDGVNDSSDGHHAHRYMPEWMKKRFLRKEVLYYIEPYWSTSYSISKSKSATISGSQEELEGLPTAFYETASATYEDWLVTWCKRLYQLSQTPERTIFYACQTTFYSCPQVARFLLPYLIQNVLRTGNPQVYQEIKGEIMAVMVNHVPAFSEHGEVSVTGAYLADDADQGNDQRYSASLSRHHQCAQTIFSTLDELNEWVWNHDKKRQTNTAASSIAEVYDQEKENLEELLKDIPCRTLSNAAYSIKAYARAISYIEIHLRQLSHSRKRNEQRILDISAVDLSIIAENATYLQKLFCSMDETDAIIGLATIRRIHRSRVKSEGVAMEGIVLDDLLYQVAEYEQLAQWENALACYEQALQQLCGSDIEVIGEQSDRQSLKERFFSGSVRCLIQLGRLESALQQINGIVCTEPKVLGALYQYALECAWRLSRWDLLNELLQSDNESSSGRSPFAISRYKVQKIFDVGQLETIRVLQCLNQEDKRAFNESLRAAQLRLMGPLSAACVESYPRAYIFLHRLHFLHELDQGWHALRQIEADNAGIEKKRRVWNDQSNWAARYHFLASSHKFREPILAIRRVLLLEMGLKEELAGNWHQYARLARKEGYMRTAMNAVMHMETLSCLYTHLERAKLLVHQGRVYEALHTIEPVPLDPVKLDRNDENPRFQAKTLLHTTNWMQSSGQRQGVQVVERYLAVIRLDPSWEKGYFHLARYYEYLLQTSYPELHAGSTFVSTTHSAPARADSKMSFRVLLIQLMRNYIQTLKHGTKSIYQSLPRLLTLWFEYGQIFYMAMDSKKALRQLESAGLRHDSVAKAIVSEIAQLIEEATELLPAFEWLVCFPQVLSRICHPNPAVVEGVTAIILRVLTQYPAQAMWPILGLSRSLNTQRRERARDIISRTQKMLISQRNEESATSFSEGMRLTEELIALASYDSKHQRKMQIRLSRIRTKILIPVQAALGISFPSNGQCNFSQPLQVYIKAISDRAEVLMTKEKPKKLELLGSDGCWYTFLCKREKTGDLRKDARMMEFNIMINKLLQKNTEARKRKLGLRTYAVVCLNEECGLMEWVQNTRAMRQLIGQIHKTENGSLPPLRLTHEIKDQFLGMQRTYNQDSKAMAAFFEHEILSKPIFQPRFHQWFYNNFGDPSAWFEARLTFTRSVAVWSMVGHIIGLGDRHCENILVDCTNGECVHVDFDCLFDKGLKLAKPEIVPFRLTCNMIDAFGITGYEGAFRRVGEVTLRLLRDHKEALRSVLESFIHDPLVEWGRKGKGAHDGVVGDPREIGEISFERSKEETQIILITIDDRLRGIYNLGDAVRPLISSSQLHVLPKNELLPLSVEGQVEKLISEATSMENLAQMYIGWMPFL